MTNLTPIQYDYAAFTLNNGQTNYDVKATIAALFDNVKVAKRIIITYDKNLTVRFNNVNLPAVPLPVRRSPYQPPQDFLDVTNIFLTNASGENAEVQIWLI